MVKITKIARLSSQEVAIVLVIDVSEEVWVVVSIIVVGSEVVVELVEMTSDTEVSGVGSSVEKSVEIDTKKNIHRGRIPELDAVVMVVVVVGVVVAVTEAVVEPVSAVEVNNVVVVRLVVGISVVTSVVVEMDTVDDSVVFGSDELSGEVSKVKETSIVLNWHCCRRKGYRNTCHRRP